MQDLRDPDEILRAISSGYLLPSLSVVAVRLIEAASDDRCTAQDLAQLIEMDPSLAVRVLNMANSVLFSTGQPVSTIQQAVMRIGFHRLRVLALSLSLRDTFPMGRVGPLNCEEFWRAAIYRAMLGKTLADRARSCDPDLAFLAGLTLEIGLLILVDLKLKDSSEQVPEIQLGDIDGLIQWEVERFGFHHRQIGEAALTHWGFPREVTLCQRIETAVNPSPLCDIIQVASDLTGCLLNPSVGDVTEALGGLGPRCPFPQEVIQDSLIDAMEGADEIASQMKVEMDKERDLLELMEKANQALAKLSEKMGQYSQTPAREALPSFETLNEAEELRPWIDRTLQAVAHEIRNPLMVVGGFAKRLSKALDPETPSGKYAQIILKEAARLEAALESMGIQRTA